MKSLKWSNKRPRSNENSEDIDIISLLSSMAKEKMSHGSFESNNLYSVDNNIYFQDDITMDNISALNKELRLMQYKLIDLATNYNIETPPIKLHLTTHGGDVFAALSVIDCINELKIPVHTIVDAYTASAGTLISIVGAKRYIKPHGHMLIHQVRSEIWGKMNEIEDEVTNLRSIMNLIKKLYIKHTNLKPIEIREILKQDINWNAQECLAKGLVDEILM